MTGRENALFWGIKLPDLASRLAGARSAELHAPDDILFAALLVKLFADRQLFPSPDAIQYLVTRIERSFKSAQIIVALIDRIALSKQQAVTRSLIGKILASADHSSD
jgi:chromosomal replication initiation ATPase DnaA